MNYTLEEFNLSKFLYIRYIFLNSIVINTYLTPIHIFLLLVRSIWTKFKLINISLHIQTFICDANSFSLKLLLGIVFLLEVLWNRRRIVPRIIQLNVKTSQQKKDTFGMGDIITLISCQRPRMECHADARPCPPASRNRTSGCRTFQSIPSGQ